jgi:hypothetical protein
MRKYSVFSLLPVMLAILIISCSKMDDSFKEYVVPNGITYVGRADSVAVFPGKQRIKITWLRGTDPNTRKAVIYWNNKNDSLVIPVTQTNPKDTVTAMINNLPEGSYAFNIYTYDDAKNSSIRVDVQGSTYGTVYESTILSRALGSARVMGDDVKLGWPKGEPTSFATEINYTDLAGLPKRTYLPAAVDTIILTGVKEGSTLTYRSLYKPTNLSIDTFYTVYSSRALNMATGKTVLQSSAVAANPGSLVLDGLTTTSWQPLAADRTDDKKVWLTIDLKAPKEFNQLRYLISAGATLLDGYKVLGSDDNTVWQTLYEKAGAPTTTEEANFPAVTKRYVRLELSVKTDNTIGISELEVYNKK